MATEGHLRHLYARRVLRTMILNLKRQLRTRTNLEIIFDDLRSFRRVFGDFENLTFGALSWSPFRRRVQGQTES